VGGFSISGRVTRRTLPVIRRKNENEPKKKIEKKRTRQDQ
jgi:hypothetical protein